MPEDRPPPQDGYEYTGPTGPEMRLIDPVDCPRGHPLTGQRGYAPCSEHGGHPKWTCGCGQVFYLHAGKFVNELPCR